MNGDRAKVFVARWLYRWGLSQGIIGSVFNALTFAGVFTLLLGPVLSELFGIGYAGTLLLLVGMVAVIVLALGVFLDRVAKFWAAQALVGVVRNPFLIDRLYQKELLTIATEKIPELKALRSMSRDPRIVVELDASIARLEAAVRNKRWDIQPGEETYEDSG